MSATNGRDTKLLSTTQALAALSELGEAFTLARLPEDLVAPLAQHFPRLVDSEEAWLVWPGPMRDSVLAWRVAGGSGPDHWEGPLTLDPASEPECPAGLSRLYQDLQKGQCVRYAFSGAENGEACLLLRLPAVGGEAVDSIPVLKCLRSLLGMAFEAIHKGSMLSRGKAEWEKAFDAATDLFVIHDRQGGIFRANLAVSRFVGQPIRQCVGKLCGNLFPGMCTDSDTVDMEWTHRRSDRSFRVSTQTVNLSGREAVLHVLHEITEERHLAALASERQKLDLTRKMLQGIAHEIRNPLFGISTVMQALQARYVSDSEVTVYINTVLTEVSRLDGVVRRFLHLAFMDDRTSPAPAGVADILRSAVGLLRDKCRDVEADRIHLHEPLSDIMVNVHKDTLVEALSEIMENGLGMAGGASDVSVDVTRRSRDVLLSFSDNGPGIQAEHVGDLFEPFFTTRPHRTGLGLALVRAAVARDGGSVEAHNNTPSPGATFLVTLPLAL